MAGFELQEGPARPTDEVAGPISPDESWSPLERWIWQRLQAGAVANIDEYEDGQGRLPPADPRKPEDWQDGRRRLAPRFLEDLLLREPYRSALHRKGVRIEGAWFEDSIDLEWAEITRQIWLEHCRFEQSVLLVGLHTSYVVSFDGSAFAADLSLWLARIGAQLSAARAKFNDAVLNGAKVSGQVNLSGANVAGGLSLDSADIGQHLFMHSRSEHRAEFNDVVLNGAKVGGHVDLSGAKVAGRLEIAAEIGQSLFMRSGSEHSAEFNDVILNGAKVRGQVNLSGAKVAGNLDMHSAEIGQHLLMGSGSEHRAEFNDVILDSIKVGRQVDLSGAKVAGKLDLDSAEIDQHLLMGSGSEHRAEFNDVVLNGAKVGGVVDLFGSKVCGRLDMHSAYIGQHLWLGIRSEHGAEFVGEISLGFANIRRNLELRGAVLSSLDLTGIRVGGELRLASHLRSPQWQDRGKLVLRNASVNAIQDTDKKNVWPPILELDGFTYRQFGGSGPGAKARVARRGSRWFIDWLAKDEPYTPQPYQQCAQVLREMGHPEMANAVLYAGRERERKEAWRAGNNPRGTGLTLLKWFVGYGYGPRLLWHPLAWVVALVAAGTAVLHLTGVPKELAGSNAAVVAYSLDTLLPIVELEKSFADIEVHGLAKYYFYFQKLMGWVLASFLIAGLSGLTK